MENRKEKGFISRKNFIPLVLPLNKYDSELYQIDSAGIRNRPCISDATAVTDSALLSH